MMDLSRKSVLVTGAGSGIGRAAVVALARKGARLTLTGRREGPLEETARLVEEAGGELEVVRGAEDRSAMTRMSREQPRRLDEQVASIKGDLEAAVANHSSM